MIGRPRRRHIIDHSGRLQRASASLAAPPKRQHLVDHASQQVKHELRSRWVKAIIVMLAGVAALFLIWVVVGSLVTYTKVTDTNRTKRAPSLSFLGEIKPNQLQGEGDGRINVLLIGIGGAKHPGGQLADTIMVASLDPKNKEAALLSIPRDLYVPIVGNGYGKLNAVHSYGEQSQKQSGGGPTVMKKTVSQILDLPIHYYVRVDFTALQKTVDALGGVTVEVEKPIVDLQYPADNMIDYSPFRLAAGVQKLDGKTALRYARSRHAAGSEGSDFARARRQQKLIDAIKEQSLSLGVIGNPKKVTEFMGIVGDHIKTDISFTEAERFFQLWKEIDSQKVVTKVLDNGIDGPLVSHSGDERGYILLTRTGDFTEVQQIAHEIFTDPYLRQEKATISLINASGKPSLATQVMKQLTSYGYTVTDNTPSGQKTQKAVELIHQSGTKPYTTKFLESRFKTQAVLRRDKNAEHDLVLTLGSDYRPPSLKNSLPVTPSPKVTPKLTPSPKSSPKETSEEDRLP